MGEAIKTLRGQTLPRGWRVTQSAALRRVYENKGQGLRVFETTKNNKVVLAVSDLRGQFVGWHRLEKVHRVFCGVNAPGLIDLRHRGVVVV